MKPSSSKPSLREGFTTGSAAAGAAAGAVTLLLEGKLPPHVHVALPPFIQDARGITPVGEPSLTIPLAGEEVLAAGLARAQVVKDGGDDPDATHGMVIQAYASLTPIVASSLPESALPRTAVSIGPDDRPPQPLKIASALDCPPCTIFLYSGKGIGAVTLPGLPIPPGEPAINPEPRKQIARAACDAAVRSGYRGEIHVLVCAEEGEERAKRTLNARLGIMGGISILGTRGTVRPYSHEAWQEAILQGLNVATALGLEELLLCTGRRSERLGFGLYPGLPPQAGIQAADFAAFTLREAATRPFTRLRWICFPGKLLKLAQGLEWTHAKAAAADISMLAKLCREAGGGNALAQEVINMPTATGAMALMRERDCGLHWNVLETLGGMAYGSLQAWLEEAQSGWTARNTLSLHVFAIKDEELLLSLQGLPSDK